MGLTRAEATAEVRQSHEPDKPALMELITELRTRGNDIPDLLQHAIAGEAVGLLKYRLAKTSAQGKSILIYDYKLH